MRPSPLNNHNLTKLFKFWVVIITALIFTACPGKEEVKLQGYVTVTNASEEVIFVAAASYLKTDLTANDVSSIVQHMTPIRVLPGKSEKIKVAYLTTPIHLLIQTERTYNDFNNGNIVNGNLLDDHYVFTPDEMTGTKQLSIVYTGAREGNGNIPRNSDYRH